MEGTKPDPTFGVGHGTDAKIPEEQGGNTPTSPAVGGDAAPRVMGRTEPVGGAGKSGD